MIFELHIDNPDARRTKTTEPMTLLISEVIPPRGTALVYRNKTYYVSDVEAYVVPPGDYSLPSLEWRLYLKEQLLETSFDGKTFSNVLIEFDSPSPTVVPCG